MTVIKRDGREVEFDKTKISDAICKAIVEVDGSLADDTMHMILLIVLSQKTKVLI